MMRVGEGYLKQDVQKVLDTPMGEVSQSEPSESLFWDLGDVFVLGFGCGLQ